MNDRAPTAMSTRTLVRLLVAVATVALLVALCAPGIAGAQAGGQHPGKRPYDRWCAGCHGETGAGDGEAAAFMLPRPRDFTGAVYQIRTTGSGEIPTDADIRWVIDNGMPGTAMPGWANKLTARERDDLVSYLKTFSRFFQDAPAQPVSIGRAPRGGGDAVERGREVYQRLECFKCHGNEGRGDGTSAPTLTDDWDHPIRTADLHKNWTFNGGGSVERIFARLRTGLDGTPMPSFYDAVEGGLISEEDLWRVAQYVRSLSPDGAPRVREVIRAHIADDGMPEGPQDERWDDAEEFWVPLVGQIVLKPRWFAPMVDGVWVRALHDGERLALLLRWHDPSRSPDPAWTEWLDRIRATMTDVDGEISATQGPDRFVVQFPLAVRDEMDRPYFLGGTTRRPVYLWSWTSEPDAVQEATSVAFGRMSAAASTQVRHGARYADGEWRLHLERSLSPADTTVAPSFPVGRTIPLAFFAADGSNGEDEMRQAVSSWYSIYLDAPTPARVFVLPVSMMLLTALLGVMVVRRAQRRERSE